MKEVITMVEELAPPGNIGELDALLERKSEIISIKKKAMARHAAIVASSESVMAQTIEPLDEEESRIDKTITAFIIRRQRSIRSRFGRTAELAHGTIKFRVIPRSLETPKDAKPAINFLLRMRGGKRYLRVTYALDKDAIKNANNSLLQKLKSFGIWAGKHEHITVQARGEDEATVISRRRFPKSRHQ